MVVWWYSQSSTYYRLWYPGCHSSINLDSKLYKGRVPGLNHTPMLEDFGKGNVTLHKFQIHGYLDLIKHYLKIIILVLFVQP